MAAHPTLRAHLTHISGPLTFGARMNLADLPDDYMRVGEPDLQDAPTVSREQAVADVVKVLANEANTAFGENKVWWSEWLENIQQDMVATCQLAILAPEKYPSATDWVRTALAASIEVKANDLIAEFDSEQLLAWELSK